MASLSFDDVSGVARVHFRYAGKQFQKSLKTSDRRKAESMTAAIAETLHDLERGRLELPAGADLWEFLRTGGRREQKVRLDDVLTLEGLFKWYFEQIPDGAKEPKTLSTEHVHERHFLRIIGKKRLLTTLTAEDFQKYINRRTGEKHHKKSIRPETIMKEMKTLQMVWNRAVKMGRVRGKAPTDGLIYPKRKEKPPFQIWKDIERNIARGEPEREQWDSLFLRLSEVAELLAYAKDRKTRSAYFYPLIVFAAHTGARLSEIMRSRVEDFRLDEGVVVIREKKKSKHKLTFRRVPMSSLLREVMETYWKTGHPGGAYAICRDADEPLQESTLHEAFDWFFRGSKWQVLRGYHVLRHSFASNLALKGEDQRIIDELMGHTTEEMRRRYRHLFPEAKANAVTKLFG